MKKIVNDILKGFLISLISIITFCLVLAFLGDLHRKKNHLIVRIQNPDSTFEYKELVGDSLYVITIK